MSYYFFVRTPRGDDSQRYPDWKHANWRAQGLSKRDGIDIRHFQIMKHTHHGGFFGSLGNFLSNAVKTAGKAIGTGIHAVSDATGAITKAVSKIPVIGPALHATFDVAAGPFHLADSIAKGERIDKAILHDIQRNIADAKEVAPYVQTVVSMVPVAGSGISGALGTTLAVASGRPIDEAVVEGLKDAIPGGPAGKAVFEVAHGVMAGKPIEEIALSAVPLPGASKEILGRTLKVTKALASGERVDVVALQQTYDALPPDAKRAVDTAKAVGRDPVHALVDVSLEQLPSEVRKAVVIGVSVGHAQSLQLQKVAAVQSWAVLGKIVDAGVAVAKKDATIAAARKLLSSGMTGFDIGTGLMAHSHVDQRTLEKVRNSLSEFDKKGFDLALATHIARVVHKPVKVRNPLTRAGYYATLGMLGSAESQKTVVLKVVASNKDAKIGMKAAAQKISHAQRSWWHRIKQILGFEA